MDKITVSEAFYSIQGEGKSMGMPSIFIRLAGCNLMCGGKGTEKDGQLHNGATWRCDSIEVWKKGKTYTIEGLVNKLDLEFNFLSLLINGVRIIVTGGEPMLQQNSIVALKQYLLQVHYLKPVFEIETNGTIRPSENFQYEMHGVQWNISPKLKNSGEPEAIRLNNNLFFFASEKNAQFKFVVSNNEDVTEVFSIVTQFIIERKKVWLMPSGSDQKELSSAKAMRVAELAKLFYFNYSHRLHITIWNQKTGV